MWALSSGVHGGKTVVGPPPDDGEPFAVWGQLWTAEQTIPKAIVEGRPFWQIDNGFVKSAKGQETGYYRFSYRSLSPILMREPSTTRDKEAPMRPWRTGGSHILIAMPGEMFGRSLGMNMEEWKSTIVQRVKKKTRRRIIVRQKTSATPLSSHLRDCWAVVTHSSNVAVDAVRAGVPVFVEPTCPASPVGRLDLELDYPAMPDRTQWMRSLMSQQFTLNEMRSGVAEKWLNRIRRQVDDSSDPGMC